jgi:uncharacterized membrane protein YfcA
VRLLLPAGLVGTLIGTLLFGVLSAKTVARHRRRGHAGVPGHPAGLSAAGRCATAATLAGLAARCHAGFTSFVAHAGGPPVSFYVLPLKLPPMVFTATMSVFFAAINASKWGPYAWLGLIDWRNLSTSLALAPFAPIGVWLGLKVVKRIDAIWFYRLFHVGMALTGSKPVYDALR